MRGAFLFGAVVWAASAAGQSLPPAAEWIPPQAIAVVHVDEAGAILDTLLDARTLRAIESSPAYQKWQSTEQAEKLQGGVSFLEGALGVDWQTGLRKLAGGSLCLAAGPDKTAALVIDAPDAALLKRFHEVVSGLVKADGRRKRGGQPATFEHGGTTCHSLDGKAAYALLGNRLVLGSRREVLEAVLDTKANGGGIAASAAYKAARQATAGAKAWAFVDLSAARQDKNLEKLGGNPAAVLLFAGIAEAAKSAEWAALALDLSDGGLTVRATAEARSDAELAGFAWPSEGGGIHPNFRVPGQIAAVSLYRDLAAFYSLKDKLFPERTSGLVFFENMMEIFFSGKQLKDEVLAELHPDLRLVVAAQQYDPAVGTPQTQVPGFALVARMKQPERFGDAAEEAFQKALGLANFTRGQKALPGLILSQPTHAGVTYSVARFGKPAAGEEPLPIRFNFRPSLVKCGEHLVLSSSESLARQLIDAVQAEQKARPKPVAGVGSLVEVDAAAAAQLLEANSKTIAADNMVKKGISLEEAEAEIAVLAGLLRKFAAARLEVRRQGSRPQLQLEIAFQK